MSASSGTGRSMRCTSGGGSQAATNRAASINNARRRSRREAAWQPTNAALEITSGRLKRTGGRPCRVVVEGWRGLAIYLRGPSEGIARNSGRARKLCLDALAYELLKDLCQAVCQVGLYRRPS